MYKIIGADEKEYGPISADQFRHWISEGRINANTKVQTESSAVWKRAGELPEFAASFPITPPPPLPPPHAAPIAMAPLPAASKTNLMAVWAMIVGLVMLFPCLWWLGPLPIVLGGLAIAQIKKNPQAKGMGFAIAAIALGIIEVILAILFVIAIFSAPQLLQQLQYSMPH